MCRDFRARRFALATLEPIRSQAARLKRRAFRRCDCEALLPKSFLWLFALDAVSEPSVYAEARSCS